MNLNLLRDNDSFYNRYYPSLNYYELNYYLIKILKHLQFL